MKAGQSRNQRLALSCLPKPEGMIHHIGKTSALDLEDESPAWTPKVLGKLSRRTVLTKYLPKLTAARDCGDVVSFINDMNALMLYCASLDVEGQAMVQKAITPTVEDMALLPVSLEQLGTWIGLLARTGFKIGSGHEDMLMKHADSFLARMDQLDRAQLLSAIDGLHHAGYPVEQHKTAILAALDGHKNGFDQDIVHDLPKVLGYLGFTWTTLPQGLKAQILNSTEQYSSRTIRASYCLANLAAGLGLHVSEVDHDELLRIHLLIGKSLNNGRQVSQHLIHEFLTNTARFSDRIDHGVSGHDGRDLCRPARGPEEAHRGSLCGHIWGHETCIHSSNS